MPFRTIIRKEIARSDAEMIFKFPREMGYLLVPLFVGNFLDGFASEQALISPAKSKVSKPVTHCNAVVLLKVPFEGS
jgi:hypothetical protein